MLIKHESLCTNHTHVTVSKITLLLLLNFIVDINFQIQVLINFYGH